MHWRIVWPSCTERVLTPFPKPLSPRAWSVTMGRRPSLGAGRSRTRALLAEVQSRGWFDGSVGLEPILSLVDEERRCLLPCCAMGTWMDATS